MERKLFCSRTKIVAPKRIRNMIHEGQEHRIHGVFTEGNLWILIKSIGRYDGLLNTSREYFRTDQKLYKELDEAMHNEIRNNRYKFKDSSGTSGYKRIDDGYFILSSKVDKYIRLYDSPILQEFLKELKTFSPVMCVESLENNGIGIPIFTSEKQLTVKKQAQIKKQMIDAFNRNLLEANIDNYTPILNEFEAYLKEHPTLHNFLKTASPADTLENIIISKKHELREILQGIDHECGEKLLLLKDFTEELSKNSLFMNNKSNLMVFKQTFERPHIKSIKISLKTAQMNEWYLLLTRYLYLSIVMKLPIEPINNVNYSYENNRFTKGLTLVYNLYKSETLLRFYNSFQEHKQLIRDHTRTDVEKYGQVLRWIIGVYKCFDWDFIVYDSKYNNVNKFIPRQRARNELVKKLSYQKINIPELMRNVQTISQEYLTKPLVTNKEMKPFQSLLKIETCIHTIGERRHVFDKARYIVFHQFTDIQDMIDYLCYNFAWADNDIWKHKTDEKEVSLFAIMKVVGDIKGIVFITNANKGKDRFTFLPQIIIILGKNARVSRKYICFPSHIGKLYIRYLENYRLNFVTLESGRIYSVPFIPEKITIKDEPYDIFILFPNIYNTFNREFIQIVKHKDTFLNTFFGMTLHRYRILISHVVSQIVMSKKLNFNDEDLTFIREYLVHCLRKSMKHDDKTYQKYYSAGRIDSILLKIYKCLLEYLQNPYDIDFEPSHDDTDDTDETKEIEVNFLSESKKRKKYPFEFHGMEGQSIAFLVSNAYYLGTVSEINVDHVLVTTTNNVSYDIDNTSQYYLIDKELVKIKRTNEYGIIRDKTKNVYKILLLNKPVEIIYRSERQFDYVNSCTESNS